MEHKKIHNAFEPVQEIQDAILETRTKCYSFVNQWIYDRLKDLGMPNYDMSEIDKVKRFIEEEQITLNHQVSCFGSKEEWMIIDSNYFGCISLEYVPEKMCFSIETKWEEKNAKNM